MAFRQITLLQYLPVTVSSQNISEVKLPGAKTLLDNQPNTFYFCPQKQLGLHYNYQFNKRSLREKDEEILLLSYESTVRNYVYFLLMFYQYNPSLSESAHSFFGALIIHF